LNVARGYVPEPHIEKVIRMEYNVRLEHVEGRPLAVVRRRAAAHELSKVVPDACGTVWAVVRSLQISGAGRHVAVYLDDQINLEVGVELATPFAGSGEVVGSATPSGLVATTTHYGPYGQLHSAHKAIRDWCRENGQTFAGPSWEVYGHWKDEWNSDPSRITTEVYYLLVAGKRSGTEPTR
jgi:effector-binding domain-containing protein